MTLILKNRDFAVKRIADGPGKLQQMRQHEAIFYLQPEPKMSLKDFPIRLN